MSNVAIASAVTAYARMHMIQFKNNENCFYTDTDSIGTTQKLPPELIGSELGQLKLEATISKAVFLAPKVYGYETQDG